MRKLSDYGYRGDRIEQRYNGLRFDGKITFNKLTDVYHAAVGHDEDQPAHLHVLDTNICSTRCAEEYGNPCQRFCPAAVYELVEDGGNGHRRLQIRSEEHTSELQSRQYLVCRLLLVKKIL